VDSHVRSTLDKLGIESRAGIAGWMASSNRPQVLGAEIREVQTLQPWL